MKTFFLSFSTLVVALFIGHIHAATIATTSFELADGYTSAVIGGYSVTDPSGDFWQAGQTTGNYAGVWSGAARTGSYSTVIGNQTNVDPFLLADPDGAEGVGTFDFWVVKTGNVADPNQDPFITVEWSTDGTNWTNALSSTRISNTLPGAPGGDNTGFANYNVAINQPGDVKVRINLDGVVNGTGNSHISIDDITITSVPEPSALVLMVVAAASLLVGLRRKR